jgi:hypothetical protein
MNSCSIQIRIHIINVYSSIHVYPYFSQSFYILTDENRLQWQLPLLPDYVTYMTSKPNDISIDEHNRSLDIRSSLFLSLPVDFQIDIVNRRTPSLSCHVAVRLLANRNRYPPRLVFDRTTQSIVFTSMDSIYQIQAVDPDLSLDTAHYRFPPSIEYTLESSVHVDIDRYTGQLFVRTHNPSNIPSSFNITLIMTDFGPEQRLTTRESLRIEFIGDNERVHEEISMILSTTFILVGTCLIIVIVLIVIVVFLVRCCSRETLRKSSSSSTHPTSWKNLSPSTPDTRLIDHEYVSVSSISLFVHSNLSRMNC